MASSWFICWFLILNRHNSQLLHCLLQTIHSCRQKNQNSVQLFKNLVSYRLHLYHSIQPNHHWYLKLWKVDSFDLNFKTLLTYKDDAIYQNVQMNEEQLIVSTIEQLNEEWNRTWMIVVLITFSFTVSPHSDLSMDRYNWYWWLWIELVSVSQLVRCR